MSKNDFGNLIVSENNLQSFILKLPEGLLFNEGKLTTKDNKNPSQYKFALNGVMYCLYHKDENFGFDYEGTIQERNKLLVSNKDPVRLKYLKNKVSYFEYGYEED